MKKTVLFLATLTMAFSTFAASKKDSKFICYSAKSKRHLVASTKYGEIVVTNKYGQEVENIDSTHAVYINHGTFTQEIRFIHEDGDVVLKIFVGDLSTQAYFDGDSFYCPRRAY